MKMSLPRVFFLGHFWVLGNALNLSLQGWEETRQIHHVDLWKANCVGENNAANTMIWNLLNPGHEGHTAFMKIADWIKANGESTDGGKTRWASAFNMSVYFGGATVTIRVLGKNGAKDCYTIARKKNVRKKSR